MGSKHNRPCGTPGAVYGTKIDPALIAMTVEMPAPILSDLSEQERAQLIAKLHASIVPIIEGLFSRAWKEHFAGRLYPDQDRPYPTEHEQLF